MGEDYGMEPESKRHTMSHPPNRVGDAPNSIGKGGKAIKNDKKKVIFQKVNVIRHVSIIHKLVLISVGEKIAVFSTF